VETLCNRLERHAAAFTLSMLKTNAATWRFHSVLNPGHIKGARFFGRAISEISQRKGRRPKILRLKP